MANNELYYLSVAFSDGAKSYYFSTNDPSINVDDFVVVETIQGIEIAKVTKAPTTVDEYSSNLALKPIMHKAREIDLRQHQSNLEDAELALAFCDKQIKKLGIKMNLLRAEYTFDRSKILFTYVADDRVDFRELVKILATQLKTRIELRQIGSRDRAKLVGGIGSCGFPLCCHTFLNEFDGISINRAKNQMLALNIPKLSGHCGKLLCCLKFEDAYYSETKKDFPNIGTRYKKGGVMHRVHSFNMINRTIRLDFDGGNIVVPLDDLDDSWVKVNEKS